MTKFNSYLSAEPTY